MAGTPAGEVEYCGRIGAGKPKYPGFALGLPTATTNRAANIMANCNYQKYIQYEIFH